QREKKVTVALSSKFMPRLRDSGAILDDAIDKQEAATRSQPGKNNYQGDNHENENNQTKNQNRMRKLMDRIAQVLDRGRIVPIRIPNIEVIIEAAAKIGKPRRETDHEPFFQVERLKKNSFHQLERFAEGLEDFDARYAAVHAAI